MRQYLDLLTNILTNGKHRPNRTGVDTIGIWGPSMHFNLREGFPLLTTKKVFFRGVVEELLWFLSGDTNVQTLQAKDVHIWDEWATPAKCAKFGRAPGDLGPIYSWTWRSFGGDYENRREVWMNVIAWYTNSGSGCAISREAMEKMSDVELRVLANQARANRRAEAEELVKVTETDRGHNYQGNQDHKLGVDQIAVLLHDITHNPQSRRLIVTGWDPREATNVELPPCHSFMQFYVQDGELSCHLYQRSADVMLGVPFNIASYALLTHMIAHVCGLKVGDFVHSFGDAHVYVNHIEQVRLQLSREPRALPQLRIHDTLEQVNDPLRKLLSMTSENFKLVGYSPHPAISAPVAV